MNLTEITKVSFPMGSNISPGDYWKIYNGNKDGYYVWYNVDDSNVHSSISGLTGVQVDVSSIHEASDIASITSSNLELNSEFTTNSSYINANYSDISYDSSITDSIIIANLTAGSCPDVIDINAGIIPEVLQQGYSEKETVEVYLNFFNITGLTHCNIPLYVTMNEDYAFYEGDIIRRERERFFVDKDGLFKVNLYETDTMTAETGKDIYYTFILPSNRLVKHFTIPKGTVSANLLDLPTYIKPEE